MLTLKHIYKNYGEQIIFEDFNYSFQSRGFYLIFGPSGCGKTTLLNLIAGVMKQDAGEVWLGNIRLDKRQLNEQMAYITQDTYFVDYLTMNENLLMTCEKESEIQELAEKLHVKSKLAQFPSSLSGGEKQRFSLLQSLLSKKKIILLDEPTASLDEVNKKMIFEILKMISNDVLIICVSHDICAKLYCNAVIDFLHLEKYKVFEETQDEVVCIEPPFLRHNIYDFLKLQKRKKEKFSLVLFGIIITLSFLIFNLSIDVNGKLVSMLDSVYHYNYLNVSVPEDKVEVIQSAEGFMRLVYPYKNGADYIKTDKDKCDDVVIELDTDERKYQKSLINETLPIKGFYYEHELEAGKYFQQANEVILGYDYALKLNSNVKELVNTSITIHTPKGEEIFRVSGIFKPFEKEMIYYMQNGYRSSQLEQVVFFNDLYSNQYLYDDKENLFEKEKGRKQFLIYFDSFHHMLKFYDTYKNNDYNNLDNIYVKPISEGFYSTIQTFQTLTICLMPVAFSSMLFAALFYIFSRKQYFENSIRNLCVYQYYGYSWDKLLKNQIKYLAKEILMTVGISTVFTFVFAYVGNILNELYHLTPFYLFTTNIRFYLLVGFLASVVFILMMHLNFARLKRSEWYELLKTRRDLL